MIPESEILECSKYDVKSKKEIYLSVKKYLKNMVSKFTKLILIFISTAKKIKVDEKGREYILFIIDVYFFKHKLAVEIDEKRHTDKNIKRKDKNY